MESTSDELSDVRLFKHAREFCNILFHPRYLENKKHNDNPNKKIILAF